MMCRTEIEWCPGKCLTHKVVVKKRPKKGTKKVNNIPMTKTENCESFFNFFKPLRLMKLMNVLQLWLDLFVTTLSLMI